MVLCGAATVARGVWEGLRSGADGRPRPGQDDVPPDDIGALRRVPDLVDLLELGLDIFVAAAFVFAVRAGSLGDDGGVGSHQARLDDIGADALVDDGGDRFGDDP